jgi:DNA-binding transcriptional MerR regulator
MSETGEREAAAVAEAERAPDTLSRAGRVKKSADAFRTISEVSETLNVPQHVLRFWETKFSQVRPMKRGGGRRYYRPEDITLLRGIRDLLYVDGYTIKGVQKLLREGGVRVLQERAGAAAPAAGEEAPAQATAATATGEARQSVLAALVEELEDIRRRLAGAL